jgi:hypothetical protein
MKAVFDLKGVAGHTRERIEGSAVAGGKHAEEPHEAWIVADPFKDGFRALITRSYGFERSMIFEMDDDPADVAERVRKIEISGHNAARLGGRFRQLAVALGGRPLIVRRAILLALVAAAEVQQSVARVEFEVVSAR